MAMNLLYIGQFYPREIVKTIVADTKGRVGFSNHNFELSLIKGFSDIKEVNLRVLSAPLVYSFPHNNRHALVHKEKYMQGSIPIRSIGFINIFGLNMLTKPFALAKAIVDELRYFDDNEIDVIVNPHSLALLEGLAIARKLTKKRLRSMLIVPDVPACLMEMDSSNSVKNKLLKYLNRRNANIARTFDKYVFLTAAMNDYYEASPDNFIVMEGLIDQKRSYEVHAESIECGEKKVILYTGTLRKIFGVMELVNAFEKGNFENCELWICGSGECSEEIENRINNNHNIKFFGLVSAEKALQLQSQATILVNPRSACGNYTSYSFPSKTIEYLLAGKIVVMNHLPGIPAEYDEYLIYPKDESINSWIATIESVLKMSEKERLNRGKKNKEFILTQKTSTAQCKRIIDFIKK